MTITARSFSATIIETKSGVEKKQYMQQFAARAFSTEPNGAYASHFALDEKGFRPTFSFVDWLSANSELASKIPLTPAGKDAVVQFGDLSPELKRLCESYPLVDGEQISSIKMLCLEKDWEGLPYRTVFLERETNLSRAYFAIPSLLADPQSLEVTTLMLRLRSASIAKAALVNAAMPARLAAAETAPSTEDMVSVSLDIVSTLAWAIPEAGPFVSAGVTFVKFLMGLFLPQGPSLLEEINRIGDSVVTRLEAFIEIQDVKEGLKGLEAFSDWIKTVKARLDTTSTDTIRTEVPQLLATLEHQFDPTLKRSLLSLKSSLCNDADLKEGAAYDSASRWAIASAKLNLLFFTEAQYLFALKLKMLLIGNLYELGYDYKGNRIDPPIPNPVNTFTSLVDELTDLKSKNLLPNIINAVRPRREGMVHLVGGVGCTVAYSSRSKPDYEWLKSPQFGRHDALYRSAGWGSNDRLVRSIEDNPSKSQFQTHDVTVCMAPDPNGNQACTKISEEIMTFGWERIEIRDRAVYDGEHPQDWVLDDGKWWIVGYYPNTDRANKLKDEYVAGVRQQFDKLAKIPDALNPDALQATLSKLSDKWTPQIPKELPNEVGLIVKSWSGTAAKDDLWSDPKVTVMYRFTLRSAAGTESAKPDKYDVPDKTTTVWLEPKGCNSPEIVGLPTKGKYLDYVRFVCVYRQFRKELAGGGYKYAKERKIKMIPRDANKAFAIGLVDDAPTDFDRAELSKT